MSKPDWGALYREVLEKQPAIKGQVLAKYPETEWTRGCYSGNYPPRVVVYFVNAGITLREKEELGEWVGKLAMEFDMDARPEFAQLNTSHDFHGLERMAYALHPKRNRELSHA